jgi:ureidoacrylate peracid hydrolase
MFFSDGKMYSFLQASLTKQNLIKNLIDLKRAARTASFPVFYAPHRNFRDGDYNDWKHMTPTQKSAKASRFSELGSKGAQFHKDLLVQNGDIVVSNHWSTSGFANTDLDRQLRRHGIEYIVICGLEALTCVVSLLYPYIYNAQTSYDRKIPVEMLLNLDIVSQ